MAYNLGLWYECQKCHKLMYYYFPVLWWAFFVFEGALVMERTYCLLFWFYCFVLILMRNSWSFLDASCHKIKKKAFLLLMLKLHLGNMYLLVLACLLRSYNHLIDCILCNKLNLVAWNVEIAGIFSAKLCPISRNT